MQTICLRVPMRHFSRARAYYSSTAEFRSNKNFFAVTSVKSASLVRLSHPLSHMKTNSLLAVAFICGAASLAAQQAVAPQSDGGAAPPNWDVLLRPRTHVPSKTTTAITPADLATRLYIFADDS